MGETSIVGSQTQWLNFREGQLDKSIETPSADMFAELNWMTFPDRVKFQKSVLMFKIFNNLTPSYLQDHLSLVIRKPAFCK